MEPRGSRVLSSIAELLINRLSIIAFCLHHHPARMSDEPIKSAMRDESQADTGVVSTTEKPRARLGPMEVVILPNSDSEDEDEGEADDEESGAKIEEVGAEGEAEDFLNTYPAETEVSVPAT